MYLERFKKTNPFSLPFTFDIENTWVSLALRGEAKGMYQAVLKTSLPQSADQWGYYGQRPFQDYNYSQAAAGTSMPQSISIGWGYHVQATHQDYYYPQATAGTSLPQTVDQWGYQWPRPYQVYNYPQATAGTSFSQSAELGYPIQTLFQDNNYLQATDDHSALLKNAFEKEKMLIIEGKPASGKTSLMRRLAYEWAKEEKKLAHYDIVLYAEFRKVREKEYENIADLVIEYCKSSEKFFNSTELEHLEHILSNRVHCRKYRILLLLDGYDESSLHKQCKELHTYLTSSVLEFPLLFNVIVTTRPGYLGQHRGKEGRYTFADVLGFTEEEQKEKYILNHFASESEIKKQESIAAVNKLLKTNNNVNTLAETPLFLTFICHVHEKIVDGTVLELYCNTIWWLFDRHQKDFPDRDVPKLFEFYQGSSDKFRTIQDNYLQFPQLLHLGKMAFNNLKNDVFHESDCVQYNLKEVIQQVGLLRKDEFYDNSFRLTTTFSFPHRTIQEFLAALYCFFSREQFDHGFQSEMNAKGTTEYYRFLLRIALSDSIPINEETRTHCFDVIKHLSLDESCDALHTLNGLNLKLLNILLSQCNNILSLEMNSCIFEANSQFSFRNNASLKELILSRCTIHRGTSLDIAQLNAIDTLTFTNCNIDIEEWLSIVEEIRKSHIKCLTVSFKGYYFNNKYINQLEKCNNINIKIRINDYTLRSTEVLSFNGINIHSLTFYDCYFQDNYQLAFKECPALHTLEIFNYGLNKNLDDWKLIAKEIRNSSVKCLKFTSDMSKYLKFVQECNKIEEIYINNLFGELELFQDYTVQELISSARRMQNLKSIVFDFSKRPGVLMDNRKELIEKAGQERDPNFTVSIIPYKLQFERYSLSSEETEVTSSSASLEQHLESRGGSDETGRSTKEFNMRTTSIFDQSIEKSVVKN